MSVTMPMREPHRLRLLVLGAATASLLSACEEPRPRATGPVCSETWTTGVSELLWTQCRECHWGPTAGNGYDISRYELVLGPGADTVPNAIPGDPSSRLLTTLTATDAIHAPYVELAPRLRTWVVDCELAYLDSPLHSPQLMNPGSPEFHGRLIRDAAWDLTECAACHGDDFAGGTSEASCLGCHPKGPLDCSTCHARIAESGAHAIHLPPALRAEPLSDPAAACAGCHTVPDRFDAPGHALLAPGAPDPSPVEVRLSGAAADGLEGRARTSTPSWDPATASCSGVYCHGGAVEDPAATVPRPRWGVDRNLGCDACHGQPPASHPWTAGCDTCHGRVIDAEGALIDPTLHLDRRISLGRTEGCDGCHGVGELGAPPPGFDDGSDRSRAIGLHAIHLTTPRRLAAPARCLDCHQVPERATDPGHLDSDLPAEVFPADMVAESLATREGATASYDLATGRCSDVYCHGGGARAGRDPTPGINPTLSWTEGRADEVYCGSCHGAPPRDANHPAIIGPTDCVTCHPQSVDQFSRIRFTGPPDAPETTHLNGHVDL
jgi:predicted CxxxxCH...CXXCH cytochrome family protein